MNNLNNCKSKTPSAKASAEYARIHSYLDVLKDGEMYTWIDLAGFFDVEMDQRGKSMFRRAVLNAGRLYSPTGHPDRGLGIVMAEGLTVADIVDDKQKRAINAVKTVVTTAGSALDYKRVPEGDRNYMRRLHSQNSALINNHRLKPIKRSSPKALISDGTDMKVDV